LTVLSQTTASVTGWSLVAVPWNKNKKTKDFVKLLLTCIDCLQKQKYALSMQNISSPLPRTKSYGKDKFLRHPILAPPLSTSFNKKERKLREIRRENWAYSDLNKCSLYRPTGIVR
jgi:hypothetical protein